MKENVLLGAIFEQSVYSTLFNEKSGEIGVLHTGVFGRQVLTNS